MSEFFTAAIDPKSICLFFERKSNTQDHAYGTGCFFMRSDLVLTAKHIIEEAIKMNKELFLESLDNRSIKPQKIDFEKTIMHPKRDLALIKLDASSLPEIHPFFPAHFSMNTKHGAVVIGYNRDLSDGVAGSWKWSVEMIKEFEVIERERSDGSLEFTLEFNAPWIKPGFSGGPVLSLGGGVIAVIIEGVIGSSTGRATSIYPIMDFFKTSLD